MEASGSDTTEREALAAGASGTGERPAVEPDGEERRTVWLDTSERDAIPAPDAAAGAATERDTTDDWQVGSGGAPVTVAELEKRIDVAVATARAAEEAAMEIGGSSLEAAAQARRAAELAERASGAAAQAASDAASAAESAARAEAMASAGPTTATMPDLSPAERPAPEDFLPRPEGADPREPDPFEERITAFRLRAEKVMIRLQKLEVGADPGAGPSEVVRLRP
jgi:hypothetical protein